MQFVLVDDVAEHNEILAKKLTMVCEQHHWQGQIALKTTELAQVSAYAAACTEPTVYFLDIELNDRQTTLSLFREIQNGRHESYIVYVSAHARYSMECLHTHAFDFLLKPWTDEQLTECLAAIMRAHRSAGGEALLSVDMGSRLVQVKQADILYCSREKMNIRMWCADGSSLVWRETLDHLLTRLDPACFVLCHRSYIVNIRSVRDALWAEDQLRMQDGSVLPVSRRRAAELRKRLSSLEVQSWQ